MTRRRIVVLISGAGTNLQALLDTPDLGGTVVHVVADQPQAAGLRRADRAGVPHTTVDRGGFPDRAAWERHVTATVAAARPDVVVLAGFMRILGRAFVTSWPVINVHPSLLPAFTGARAVEDALEWGVRVTGVTVHYVDEQVDHGPIIAQEPVAVLPDDTPATLHARIQAVEHRLLPDVVRRHCSGRLHVTGRIVRST